MDFSTIDADASANTPANAVIRGGDDQFIQSKGRPHHDDEIFTDYIAWPWAGVHGAELVRWRRFRAFGRCPP